MVAEDFIPDAQVIKQVLQGDKEVFAQLVTRYQKCIYALVLSKIGEKEEAADITQEVFLKAYRSLASLRDPTKFSAWLRGIASHLAIDALRRKVVRQVQLEKVALLASQQPQVAPPAQQEASRQEIAQQVLKIIARLPENYQVPLLMRYMENCSYTQIAQRLATTRDTIRGLLYRGTRMLREQLVPLLEKDEI